MVNESTVKLYTTVESLAERLPHFTHKSSPSSNKQLIHPRQSFHVCPTWLFIPSSESSLVWVGRQ